MNLEIFSEAKKTTQEIDYIVSSNVKSVHEDIGLVLSNHHGSNLDASKFERFFMMYDDYTSENDGFNAQVLGLLTVMESNDEAFTFLLNLKDRFGKPCFDSYELKILQSRNLSTNTQYFVLKIAYLISMHLLHKDDELKIINSSFLQMNNYVASYNRNKYVKSEVLESEISRNLLSKFSDIYTKEIVSDDSFYIIDLDSNKACEYQAHGALSRLDSRDALKKLLIVLQDPNVGCEGLYTCPLASDNRIALGALGAVSPFRDSDFWFISDKNQTLAESGIKIVACKDTLGDLIPLMQKFFPDVKFVTASMLNKVI